MIAKSVKARVIILNCFLMLFLHCCNCYAQPKYEEKRQPGARVISGIDKETALKRYGPPVAVNGRLWYYTSPENFYVYLTLPLAVNLYPKFCEVNIDTPFEVKALIYPSESEVIDITPLTQLLFSEPGKFDILRPGILIPKKPGRYTLFAIYKDTYSNPAYINVKEPQELEQIPLRNLDIFPYRPNVQVYDVVDFIAYGTFFSAEQFSTREINNEVEWFVQQGDGDVVSLKSNRINFGRQGKYIVFCRAKGIESLPQEVEVRDSRAKYRERLKHISLIPSHLSTCEGNSIFFRVIATYHDNIIDEVTKKVTWETDNSSVLGNNGNGVFVAKNIGIANVTVRLGSVVGSPAKIIVAPKNSPGVQFQVLESREDKKKPEELIQDIKNDIDEIKRKTSEEKAKRRSIKLTPDKLSVALGEEKELKALSVSSDNSEEDITILADWRSLDERICSVHRGRAKTISVGNTEIYAIHKGLKSNLTTLIVEEPRLISIVLSPSNLKISMGERIKLEAEGYFTDSSHSDITSLVSWHIDDPHMLKITKGSVHPLKIGTVKVYAEYSGIKSLPVNINIVLEKYWLFNLIMKVILIMIVVFVIMSSYLYLLVEWRKKKIISLRQNTGDFIIILYDNLIKILNIFGPQYKTSLPPLSYAESVEKQYTINDGLFSKITQLFEEAKFSRHIFDPELSVSCLEDYNKFLKVVFSQQKKLPFCYKYWMTLIKQTPLFIYIKA
jgi:gas vesicle protein